MYDVVSFMNLAKNNRNFQYTTLREYATDFSKDNYPDNICDYPFEDNIENEDTLFKCFLCGTVLKYVESHSGHGFCRKCQREFPIMHKG